MIQKPKYTFLSKSDVIISCVVALINWIITVLRKGDLLSSESIGIAILGAISSFSMQILMNVLKYFLTKRKLKKERLREMLHEIFSNVVKDELEEYQRSQMSKGFPPLSSAQCRKAVHDIEDSIMLAGENLPRWLTHVAFYYSKCDKVEKKMLENHYLKKFARGEIEKESVRLRGRIVATEVGIL